MIYLRLAASICILPAAMASLAPAAPAVPPAGKVQLKQYDARYYIIYTDLDEDAVREAIVRMMAMAEEYHARTKDFGGTIPSKMPFKLFSNADDYHAAGGPVGSAGAFNGRELMALASNEMGSRLWHTVQHEAFHQFAQLVITPRLPIWVNEGMAEYFAEGLWTGDRLITGVLPPGRVRRVQKLIADKQLTDFDEMVLMPQAKWNAEMDIKNYDQAWSMVHFLVHADDGKYRALFVSFINELARNGGVSPKDAWAKRFGANQDAFQKKCSDWWAALGENPTENLYTQATVEVLTAFLARGAFLRQKYETADDFFDACKDGRLAIDPRKNGRIWLPASLLEKELAKARKMKTWSLDTPAKALPKLKLTLADGTIFTGTFGINAEDVSNVQVTVTKPKPTTAPK